MPAETGRTPAFFPGWTVVAACFLSLNFSVGIVFASYSPLVVAIQEQYGTSRALAATALSATSLMLGLCAPLVGGMVQRFSARAVMMVGCTMVMLGFVLAAFVTDIYALIAIYGLLIGVGFVAMGIVPCSTLVTRWFNHKRGLALGIINLFPGMALFPLMVTFAVTNYNLKGAFLTNAAMFALLLPILLLISNRPQDKGLEPLGGEPPATDTPDQPAPKAASAWSLLKSPAFWLLSFGIAIITGVANMLTVHVMPIMVDAGVPSMQAGSVLFVYGMVLAVTAPVFGFLVDKIGPFRALLLLILVMLAPWIGLALFEVTFTNYLVMMAIVGAANGGIVTLHTSTAARLFESALFSRAIGFGYFVKMPFLFIGPPLAGAIYDATNAYELAILGGITAIVIAGILFAILYMTNRDKAAAPAA